MKISNHHHADVCFTLRGRSKMRVFNIVCFMMILFIIGMMCFTASECQAQQQLEDKYNVEFSVDGGKTWKSRGMIVQDPSSRLNRLQFRSSLTSDAKWPKDLIQIISDRILSKKPENLMYQLRFRSPTNGEILAMNSISMVGFI